MESFSFGIIIAIHNMPSLHLQVLNAYYNFVWQVCASIVREALGGTGLDINIFLRAGRVDLSLLQNHNHFGGLIVTECVCTIYMMSYSNTGV